MISSFTVAGVLFLVLLLGVSGWILGVMKFVAYAEDNDWTPLQLFFSLLIMGWTVLFIGFCVVKGTLHYLQ